MAMSHSEAGRLGQLKSAPKRRAYLAKQHRDAEARHLALGKLCLTCQTPIPYGKGRRAKFCNHSCAARFSNSLRCKTLATICLSCGKTPGRNCVKYCSRKCAAEHRYRTYIERWLRGEEIGGNWQTVSGYVRRWLIESFGEKCSECRWAKRNVKTGKVPVQVDHKDGNPNNHQPDNVRLLCPNCHSLTLTFGNLNRGNGRKQRYLKADIGQRQTVALV